MAVTVNKLNPAKTLAVDLVAYYSLDEDFNMNLRAENSVSPYAGFSAQHPSSLALSPRNVRSAEGKIGRAAEFNFDGVNFHMLSHGDDTTVQGCPILNTHLFRFDGDRTVSFWIKFRSFNELGNSIFWKGLPFGGVEYSCHVDPDAHKLVVNETIFHSKVLEVDTWYFVLLTFQKSTNKWRIIINDEQPSEGTNAVISSTEQFAIGGDASFDGWIDEFALWYRILEAPEMSALYNRGKGLSYDEIIKAAQGAPCRSLTCCPGD